jgi:thiosulfate/3-mercaptopyruvate sulfurtransferase
MVQNISPIIQPDELLALRGNTHIVLIDVRTGPEAYDKYAKEHLEGAQHLDLEVQLADKKSDAAHGGRHPLPEPAMFAELLAQYGISADSHVVVYDHANGANAAARCWWMLRAIGLNRVQVVNGGFQAAVKAGFPVSATTEPQLTKGNLTAQQWLLPVATMEEVALAVHLDNFLVIDVRDAARYRGEVEPFDAIAGHIPGAENIPYTGNLDADGFFLSPLQLREKYSQALAGKDQYHVIVHCGSGVTACHTLLAMDYAGLGIPKLYVGSWSEWSRSGRPMATLTKK